MSSSISPNVYKILGESAALFASTLALSKTSLISWLNTPTTLEGLALCTGVQACTSAAADFANQIYNQDGDTTYKVAFQIAGLVSSFALLTALVKPIASRTGMMLNPYALVQLTAFHGIVKAIIHVGYEFAQSFSALKGIANVEDMKQIPIAELGLRKKQFEEEKTQTWDTYTLNMQAEFNAKLKANKQPLLAFTSLKTDGALSKEELEVFCEAVGDKPTVEQAKVLVANDVPPPKGCAIIPGLPASSVAVDTLNASELRWYHSALCQNSDGLNTAQYKAFANAFYKLDLTSPSPKFGPIDIPASAAGISEKQANYFFNYYLVNLTEFQALEPKQQLVLNAIFQVAKADPWDITAPKSADLQAQPKEVFEQLILQFNDNSADWDILPVDYQKAFNVELEKHGLDARELTKQPWSTKKKVAYCALGVITIAAFGLGIAYMAGALPAITLIAPNNSGTNSGNSPTPTPVPTPTPTPSPQSEGESPKVNVKPTVTEPPEYFENGDQCFLSTSSLVNTCVNPLFNHSSTIQHRVNTSTSENPVQPPITQEFSSISTKSEIVKETGTALVPIPGSGRTLRGDRVNINPIRTQLIENDNADTTSSLSGREVVVVESDLGPLFQVPCQHGFERTQEGCFARKVDNTTLPEIDSATMQPQSQFESQKDLTQHHLVDLTTSTNTEAQKETGTALVAIPGSGRTLRGDRVNINPIRTQNQNGTWQHTFSETATAVSTWWHDTAAPTLRSGFSTYIWNLDGATVREKYNAEIAEGYRNSTFGQAAFDALEKDCTLITRELVEQAVEFRDAVKTKYQGDSAYLEWALIQDRQLYEYHFQHAWNKGDYEGALKAVWSGLGQIWETGSANPTIAHLEAMGKSSESIACGAYTPNAGLNAMFGVKTPQAACREALPEQIKAPRRYSAPVVYIGSQVVIGAVGTWATKKVIQKIVWPIISTLGSLLLCCRRRKKAEPKKVPDVVTTFDNTLWTNSTFKISAKNHAPDAFGKVASIQLGFDQVPKAQFNQLAGKANQYIDTTAGTWQAALKIVAYMAAHDLLEQAKAKDWSEVEDNSITATITKTADDKVTFVVNARINAADLTTQVEYASPQAMRDAAALMV
ncbi:hypothetical protein [Simkania negevensis]|uniref:Uncharacterized protein n=1 Tax=Simkania negevensis (strain ATCC VR-1471 / DSM 27360 / Z) TaxID=331113 RepID=F8L4D4_SIMNZ|nr:hypothetical protein [Simkania negevensis]CCB90185.1 unknown protein [Simkania negevensis Z]